MVDTHDTGAPSDSGGTSPAETYAYVPPPLSICDASQAIDGGFLCAIRPSRLDAAARDVYATGSVGDENLGFGYHVVAFPQADTVLNGIYVHFTGSMGRAYDPTREEYPSQTFL